MSSGNFELESYSTRPSFLVDLILSVRVFLGDRSRSPIRGHQLFLGKESCGHDKVIAYGASEAEKLYDGDEATKRLEEWFVKLPKYLKDMLDNILSKANNPQKMRTVGFIHSGLQPYIARADCPTTYITRITKSRSYHLSNNIKNFKTSVLPAIYIAWVIKDTVKSMNLIISDANSNNNNNNSK